MTTTDKPTFTKSYLYPQVYKKEDKTQIKNMIEQGLIRPSNSPFSSPVWIVPKKIDAPEKQQ